MEKFFLISKFRFLLVQFFMVNLAMSDTNLSTDGSALLTFKSHITSDNILLTKNWTTAGAAICNRFGVSCGNRHQRITSLTLSNMSLTGTIVPELGNLSFLVSLTLSRNNFRGKLPDELGRLRRLKSLNLEYNEFTGEIPAWIMNLRSLEFLNLQYNQFSGSIPTTIFNMSSLQRLGLTGNSLSGTLPFVEHNYVSNLVGIYLSFNQLYGEIPASLYRCRRLEILSLSFNEFTGNIPRESGNLTMLRQLYVNSNQLKGGIPGELSYLSRMEVMSFADNNLTGSVPFGLFNMSSLKKLTLSNNSLSGYLPLDFCHHLPIIEVLHFANTKFIGSIPTAIGNCTNLKTIEFSNNHFSGSIPDEIGELHSLDHLHLGFNNLTGPIPSKLFNSSTIRFMSLVENQLSGLLPSDLGLNLPNLEELYIGINKLSGRIPSSIGNASKLSYLSMGHNSFFGFIPNTFGNLKNLILLNLNVNNLTSESEFGFLTSLTNCRQLSKLWLSFNPLNGSLTSSIGNLSSSLQSFSASNCNINGKIPSEIGNLSNLFELTLDRNALTRSIPTSVGGLRYLQGLDLRNNEIQGSIPDELCNLSKLSELFLSRNQLSRSIPRCLGSLTSLRTLSLDSNKLTSTIPDTFWNLRDILVLNLSSNFLSGSLPLRIENLKVITSLDLSRNQFSNNIPSTIGGLERLTLLSLAHNRLQGSIPQSLGNIISLEFLDLSHNNLSGEIPKSLEALVYLKYMNMSYNRLHGEIPSGGPFANFTAQSFLMNDGLCGSRELSFPSCSVRSQRGKTRKLRLLKIILPITVSLILVVACVFALIRFWRMRRRNEISGEENLLSLPLQTRISYQELLQATNWLDESNLIGKGSFGSVYQGILCDGTLVACKVFNLEVEAAFKSFDVECEVMRNVRHRNLVKIISSCSNIDMKCLVMEYMANGSLEKWLYFHNHYLDILQRMNIMIDVASALQYLHHEYSTSIVHCDLKPSNVLLDENMVAHVSDFGIAKLLGHDASAIQTKTLATIGYMAPEYGTEGRISTRGDVYSYGIMLMETFTRKKPTDDIFSGETSLKSWVSESLNGSIIIQVVDSNLVGVDDDHFAVKEKCAYSILSLALECTADLPEERNNMKDVLTRLEKIRAKFLDNSHRI